MVTFFSVMQDVNMAATDAKINFGFTPNICSSLVCLGICSVLVVSVISKALWSPPRHPLNGSVCMYYSYSLLAYCSGGWQHHFMTLLSTVNRVFVVPRKTNNFCLMLGQIWFLWFFHKSAHIRYFNMAVVDLTGSGRWFHDLLLTDINLASQMVCKVPFWVSTVIYIILYCFLSQKT